MRYHLAIRVVGVFLAFLAFLPMSGQDDCFPEAPNGLVLDEAGILSAAEEQTLNQTLVNFDNSNSVQIAVVTVTDLCGMDAGQFSHQILERWGVGQEGLNNGVVVLVKPTGGQGQRRTYIQTGYGVEGALPDATCKLIVENEMIPRFKQGDMYGGVNAAVSTIMQITAQEYTAEEYGKKHARRKHRNKFVGGGVVFLILLIFFISRFARARSYASANNIGFWAAWALLNSTNRRHGGGFDNFSSGSGGFGGFGGGGFGGFGGGLGGGGGAGGSW